MKFLNNISSKRNERVEILHCIKRGRIVASPYAQSIEDDIDEKKSLRVYHP